MPLRFSGCALRLAGGGFFKVSFILRTLPLKLTPGKLRPPFGARQEQGE